MLIEELTLSNVYVFCGTFSLKLACDGKGFTLIMARNNAGKTSVIRALKYLFYGPEAASSDGAAGSSKKVLNLEALRKAGSAVVEGYVEAKLRLGAKKYTLRRSIRAQVPKGKPHTEPIIISEQATLTHRESKGDRIVDNPDDIEMTILAMLPKRLFDFYFFKGEELQNQLIDNPSAGIGKDLFGILFRRPCEQTVSTLTAVIKAFDRQFAKAEEGNEKLSEWSARVSDVEERLEKAKATESQDKEREQTSEQDYLTADAEYVKAVQNHNPTLGAQLKEAKSLLDRALAAELAAVNRYHGEVRKSLIEALPSTLAESAWDNVRDLHEKKLLPPSVSEGLLAQILRDALCICGRSLAAGEQSREYVEDYRKRAVAEKVSERIYSLYTRLQPGGSNTIQTKRIEVLEALDRSEKRVAEARDDVAKREDQVRQLDGRYDEKQELQVSAKKKARDRALHIRDAARTKHADSQREVQRLEENAREIQREFAQMSPGNDERSNLASCREVARLMRHSAEQFQKSLQGQCHSTLSSKTKSIYSSIVTDKSDAIIDANTLLPEIRKEGTKGYEAGGGQRQVLLLAFLIAMDKLRKELETYLYKEFRAPATSEQCFFMDSVFSPMDQDYRAAVAGYLPGEMPQLVFLVAPQHWDDEVAKKLLPNVQRLYVLLLHTNKVPEQDPRSIQFGKSKSPLVKIYPKSWESVPFTEVVEVKI